MLYYTYHNMRVQNSFARTHHVIMRAMYMNTITIIKMHKYYNPVYFWCVYLWLCVSVGVGQGLSRAQPGNYANFNVELEFAGNDGYICARCLHYANLMG